MAGQTMQLRVPLGTLARGTYTVTWRNTSAVDGHTTVGSVAFGVDVRREYTKHRAWIEHHPDAAQRLDNRPPKSSASSRP